MGVSLAERQEGTPVGWVRRVGSRLRWSRLSGAGAPRGETLHGRRVVMVALIVRAIFAVSGHSARCAPTVDKDGRVRAWGGYSHETDVPVELPRIAAIACGALHSLAFG